MPHIRVTGMDLKSVQELSKELAQALAEAFGCPIDWITFSAQGELQADLICGGAIVPDTVRIYVEWFDRGQQVKDATARLLSDHIMKSHNGDQPPITEVTVIFVKLQPTDYYENGRHC